MFRQGSIWASTLGWGRNQEPGSDATNAFLAETNLTVDDSRVDLLLERHTNDVAVSVLKREGQLEVVAVK